MAERLVSGDTVTLTNVFAVDDVATDPTTVTVTVTDPDGVATTNTYGDGTLTKTATGTYQLLKVCTTVGLWSYQWSGTGGGADIEAGQFEIVPVPAPTADTLDVLSLLEAKHELGIGPTDPIKDSTLARKITAVSRRLDQAVGPIVRRTITGEVHEGGCDWIQLRHRPVFSITTVTEYDATTATVLTAEDYDTQPTDSYLAQRWPTSTATYNGVIIRRSSGATARFPVGPEAVRVTYVAGRYATTATVDPVFKEAAAVMLKNAWRTQEAAVQALGEFDVPAQNFPTFGIPNYVRDLLADEWVERPGMA